MIDFNHWKGSQIGDDIQTLIYEKSNLQIVETLKPVFSLDGDQYCFLYGSLPNDCILGFGETPLLAVQDFCNNFRFQKAKIFKK